MIDYEWLKSLWDNVWYACGIKKISKLLNSQEKCRTTGSINMLEKSWDQNEESECYRDVLIKVHGKDNGH